MTQQTSVKELLTLRVARRSGSASSPSRPPAWSTTATGRRRRGMLVLAASARGARLLRHRRGPGLRRGAVHAQPHPAGGGTEGDLGGHDRADGRESLHRDGRRRRHPHARPHAAGRRLRASRLGSVHAGHRDRRGRAGYRAMLLFEAAIRVGAGDRGGDDCPAPELRGGAPGREGRSVRRTVQASGPPGFTARTRCKPSLITWHVTSCPGEETAAVAIAPPRLHLECLHGVWRRGRLLPPRRRHRGRCRLRRGRRRWRQCSQCRCMFGPVECPPLVDPALQRTPR